MNWFCMHESIGKSITQNNLHKRQNMTKITFNVAIMTQKGWQATQFQLLLAINYSFVTDYMAPIWSNGQGPRTFDTFPKVQVVRKYIIEAICDSIYQTRYQLLEEWILSYEYAKSKYLKIESQSLFWDFTYRGIFNT